MIIHGCIETLIKDCGRWIIEWGQGFNNFRTSILRNFTGGVIKCNDASSTQRVHEGLPVLVYTQGTICS